jgi:endonuclease/exonuclease/phosphatase family metal-dependent hydrolase
MLTYNIHKAIGVDRKFAPQRIVEVLRHHDADILLLQEVDRGVPRSANMDLALHLERQLEYGFRAVGMNVFLKKGQYGNATLSRYPIGRQRNIDLTIGRNKRRGAQHARIEMRNGKPALMIEVFNVHLSLTARLRRTQVSRLLTTADISKLPSDVPCIIGGDTNDWRGELKHHFLNAGFKCATNKHRGSRWAIKTFPSFAPTSGLDKVFYRGPVRLAHVFHSRLKLARVASDHLPVICDFELG